MFLSAALVLFVIFTLNVAMGSFGGTPFLGDVGEMLTLLAASIAFVAALLKSEMKKNQKNKSNQRENTND